MILKLKITVFNFSDDHSNSEAGCKKSKMSANFELIYLFFKNNEQVSAEVFLIRNLMVLKLVT